MAVSLYTHLSDLLHGKMIDIYSKGLMLCEINCHIKFGKDIPAGMVRFPDVLPVRPNKVRTLRFHDKSILEIECCYGFLTTGSSDSDAAGIPLELRKVELHYTGESYVLPTQFITQYIKLMFRNAAEQLFYTEANKVVIL